MFIDYYKILSLKRDSTFEEIKRSHRKLALKYHPDINKSPDANDKFLKIQEAYEILSDISNRAYFNILYDKYVEKKEQKASVIQIVEKNLKQHQNQARATAKEYSYMKFNDYKEKVIDSIFVAFDATTDFLAIVLALVFGGTGIYGFYGIIVTIRTAGEGAFLDEIPNLLLSIFFTLVGVFYIIGKITKYI